MGRDGATGATGPVGPAGPPGPGENPAVAQFWLRADDAEQYPLNIGAAVRFSNQVNGPSPQSPTLNADNRTIRIRANGLYYIDYSVAYDSASTQPVLAADISFAPTQNGSPIPQLRYVQRSITYQFQLGQPAFYLHGSGLAALAQNDTVQLINYGNIAIAQPTWQSPQVNNVGASITLLRVAPLVTLMNEMFILGTDYDYTKGEDESDLSATITNTLSSSSENDHDFMLYYPPEYQ